VKLILPLLLLTSLGLMAQSPPSPAPAPPAVIIPAPGASTNGGPGALQRLIPPPARGVPPSTAPNAGVPSPGAATVPTAPSAPSAIVNPTPGATETPIPAKASGEQTIPPGYINWTAADIASQVLPIYADLVGRSILRPANLPATPIEFKNQTELTKHELIQAIDALLALNGVEMINVGDKFVKAVPLPQAGNAGGAIHTNQASQLPELGGYQTHVVQLKYIKPSEVMPVITPFASVGMAPPIAIESSQMVIIRDNAENVKRMLEMIEKVDVSIPSEFVSEVIPIKYAQVEDIAAALNSLSGGGGGTTVGAHTGTRAGGATGMTTGARPGQVGYNPNQPMLQGGLTSPTGNPSSGASFSDRIKSIINRAASSTASGDLQILGVTKIVADARSNSLLIFATRQDMAMIKDIVSKLDVVLAQVLIETIIFDVTIGDTWALGVSAAQRPKQFTPDVAGAGGYNNSQQFFNWLNNVSSNNFPGNSTSVLPPGLSYWGKFGDTWDVVVQAAAGDSRIKVIQKPQILTSHATPASLFIGQTVPYVSSTYYGGGYAGGPSSSYQQLQVGIGLNVTPYINPDGLVVMQIDEQISDLNGSTYIVGVGDVPNTKTSTLSAEVAVRDGESIILGGIIRNSDTKTSSGVPYLKDIPLLGALFRTSNSNKGRQETIVLMRPTVLKTPELAAAQVAKEKQKLPGILEAEREVEKYERDAARKEQERSGATSTQQEQQPISPVKNPTQQEQFNKVTPFTPAEIDLYGKPAPASK
jgi:general secretion pathway protein D